MKVKKLKKVAKNLPHVNLIIEEYGEKMTTASSYNTVGEIPEEYDDYEINTFDEEGLKILSAEDNKKKKKAERKATKKTIIEEAKEELSKPKKKEKKEDIEAGLAKSKETIENIGNDIGKKKNKKDNTKDIKEE